jgi:hypothetical protein
MKANEAYEFRKNYFRMFAHMTFVAETWMVLKSCRRPPVARSWRKDKTEKSILGYVYMSGKYPVYSGSRYGVTPRIGKLHSLVAIAIGSHLALG